MTISTQQNIATFLGNGSTTVFQFSYNNAVPYNSTETVADYTVTYTSASSVTTVVSPTAYTLDFTPAVVGSLWGIGGTLTYSPAIASGTSLQLTRMLPYEQLTSISNQGNFSPQVIEQAMDELEMQIQQIVPSTSTVNPATNIIGATFSPTSSTPPANGLYLPGANQVGISANSELGLSIGYYTGTGTPVNSLEALNAGTGYSPVLQATGSDTNVGIIYCSQGSGDHAFVTNGPVTGGAITQCIISHTINAVNPLTITGGISGSNATIASNSTGFISTPGVNVTGSTIPTTGICDSAGTLAFSSSGANVGLINNTGLFILCNAAPSASVSGTQISNPATQSANIASAGAITTTTSLWKFYNANGQVGGISVTGSATTFATSSDYRLKDNVETYTDGLQVVEQLRPVTFNWKASGSPDCGFLAHEVGNIIPNACVGKKDAVNKDGSIAPQAVDASFIIPYLVSAVQELSYQNSEMQKTLQEHGIF